MIQIHLIGFQKVPTQPKAYSSIVASHHLFKTFQNKPQLATEGVYAYNLKSISVLCCIGNHMIKIHQTRCFNYVALH